MLESAITRFLDSVNRIMLKLALVISVWCADGVVSVMAMENMRRVLGFSPLVSVLTGIALEGVGVVASYAALKTRRWNQSLEPGDKPALEWLAWLVAGLQFAVGFALIAANAVWQSYMALGTLAIGTLSALGTLAHVLSDDVDAREAKREKRPVPANDAPTMPTPAPTMPERSIREHVLDCYRANPHAKHERVGEAVGVSRQTVGRMLGVLEQEGAIRRNGHGVEVL